MKQLVLASGNAGKLAEFGALFGALQLELVAQSQWRVAPCDEPAPSFVENALAKARHAAQHTGRPALADDSGLCVAALGGEPGVRSARFASVDVGDRADDAANNALLLDRLRGVAQRQAHFVCVLVALRRIDDPEPLIAHGWLHGSIAEAARGSGGFGYDSLFVPGNATATLAELDSAAKNAISHRGRAAAQMARLLQAFWGVETR
jgi:XTP/dITP diphosphohydrolase